MNILCLNRKNFRRGIFLLILFSPHSSPAYAEKYYENLNASISDSFVLPRYRALESANSALSVSVTQYCNAPNADNLTLIRKLFSESMTAWQQIRIIRFGPVMKDSRYTRIQFWPDKRGTAARQIRQALANEDPQILNKGGLIGKSVALQNLSTFEYLLTTTPNQAFTCELMAAIAAFQTRLAHEVVSDWEKPRGFRDTILSAGTGNPTFETIEAPATAFLKSVITLLDVVIRQKLQAPLGTDINRSFPKKSENWRTGLARRNLVANLNSIIEIFEISGGFSGLLAEKKDKFLAKTIVQKLRGASKTIDTLPLPLSEAVTTPKTRAELEAVIANLQDVRILIGEYVVNTLGLTIGFNALDGD
jgi:predicted lipoprotein